MTVNTIIYIDAGPYRIPVIVRKDKGVCGKRGTPGCDGRHSSMQPCNDRGTTSMMATVYRDR